MPVRTLSNNLKLTFRLVQVSFDIVVQSQVRECLASAASTRAPPESVVSKSSSDTVEWFDCFPDRREGGSAGKKRKTCSNGKLDIPDCKHLSKLSATADQLDFCIERREFAQILSTSLTSRSKTFQIKYLKPILNCYYGCCRGNRQKFLDCYPKKLKLGIFGSERCIHRT